jgi:sugar lactone lactonase YvrE
MPIRHIALPFLLLTAWLAACSEPVEPTAISGEAGNAMAMIGSPATARPLAFTMPAHPYMSRQGVNAMHSDGYSSDVHPGTGPLGRDIQLNSRVGSTAPGGQCATLTFNSEGRLVALCAGMTGFRIHLLTPRTLELLAEYKLPQRPSSYEALISRDKSKIMEDSSGAYFYLDNEDRVVMAASDQTIRRVAHRQTTKGEWEFYTTDSWDLSEDVPHDCVSPTNWSPEGECDPITAVMPDHEGYIWWVTRRGRLGTLDPRSGEIRKTRLAGEEIQNGFSVAEDGVYIVSDHAMYRFHADENGAPLMGWREAYDRGTSRKVGTINQGSGTTPTLMGERYVTITDNADERINLLVYKRRQSVAGERQICSVPLFQRGHSVTDNSMIGFNRSIVIENNAGYTSAHAQSDWSNAGGGIMRIDVREDESGCDIIWESPEHSTSVVPKLSAANGLAYFYTFEPQADGVNAWYLTALDFVSGETRFKILTGYGPNFDNNWAPLTLAPDGTAYVGTSKGLVAIWDNS